MNNLINHPHAHWQKTLYGVRGHIKGALLVIILSCMAALLHAQPIITRLEYYIDNDPGWGKGTALAITPAADIPQVNLTYNFAALQSGVHIIGIRSKDTNGVWSLDNKWLFLKPYNAGKTAILPKITRLEYYIDTDPGWGNGTALTITPGTILGNVAFNLDFSALAEGVHTVGIRSQDSLGAWSLDNKWLFAKTYTSITPPPQPAINRVEYYIDNDPGWGNGTNVAITPKTDITTLSIPIDMTALQSGVHIAAIRSQDSLGAWSLDNKWLFVKPYTTGQTAPVPKITRLEYFIDNDPGKGKATTIPITPATILGNVPFTITMDTLAAGVHIAGIRSQDSLGRWSLDNKWLFLKKYNATTVADTPSIARIEYYFDADPGYGHGTRINLTHVKDLDTSFPFNISGISLGQHFIGVRTQDSLGVWSLDNKFAFTKSASLTASATSFEKLATEKLENKLRLQYNPVHSEAILLYTATRNNKINIRVVDAGGRLVQAAMANVYKGVNPITIKTGSLAQGIYIVQADGEALPLSVKMMKE